jgi:hypothetical protein
MSARPPLSDLWARWVAFCGEPESVLPLALVRILVAFVLVADLARVGQLGLVDVQWRPFEHGGLSTFSDGTSLLADAPAWAGPATYGLTITCLVLVAFGVFTRPAMLVAVLAYAQLGHLYPPGDRAIDRLLRTVLLLLLFSGCHKGLALSLRHARNTIAHWPSFLLRWLLVLVYTSSGIGKVAVTRGWLGWTTWPPLYRIVTDPMAGTLDPLRMIDFRPVFQVASWATIALELSSFLLFTRWAPWWGVMGVLMHLGIFSMMELGMFSWGMLALYPVVFSPWLVRAMGTRRN